MPPTADGGAIRGHMKNFNSETYSRKLSTVDDFVAVKAHDFNRIQQTSISRLQQVQQQSLGINRIQQISIRVGIWFGIRCSSRDSAIRVIASFTASSHPPETALSHFTALKSPLRY